ncbi:MAG: hypothetical protein K2Q10_14350, partial [Rhodospirillales bacterium]|nr:hypothetical protein [Rhodospirillales bacterium]
MSEGTDKAAPAGIGRLLRGPWAVAAGYAVAAGTMVAIFRAHDPAVWGLAALSAAAVHVVARLSGRSGRDGG